MSRPTTVSSAVLALALCARSGAGEEPLSQDQYVALVMASHPAAQRAVALDEAARAERRSARLLPDPEVDLGWGRGSPAGEAGPSGRERGLSIRQLIPSPPRFKAGLIAANRAAEALQATARLGRWELEVVAREALSALLTARAAAEVAARGEEETRAVRDLVGRRAELGEAREADRIRVAVEWMRRESDWRAAEAAASAAGAWVRALAVSPLAEPLVLQPEASPASSTLDRAALRARLEAHPRLQAAAAEAARARAELSVARRARIPDLVVGVTRDREIDKRATAVSVGLVVPLWNANRGAIARAEAAAALAEAELRQQRLTTAAELEQRLTALEVAAGRRERFEREIVPAASRTLELARLSYEAGESSLLDLLDAQRTHTDARREAVETRQAFVRALSEVRQLVGPGFNPWSER